MLPLDVNKEDTNIKVCKTMFLHTLGRQTDSFVTQYLKAKQNNGIVDTIDKRGQKMVEKNKILAAVQEERIIQYINSFHPVVSHYNLVHSPNRRYLPMELSIASLHQSYNKTYEKVHYETFRQIFKKQNIGIKRPSQDECPICMQHNQHMEDFETNLEDSSSIIEDPHDNSEPTPEGNTTIQNSPNTVINKIIIIIVY